MTVVWKLHYDSYLLIQLLLWLHFLTNSCQAWLPDSGSKLVNNLKQISSSSIKFTGNLTHPDQFVILNQDEHSILLGGRNKVYNLSIYDFNERIQSRIEWPSSEAHNQLCFLKGKTEDDCQNYIRILYRPEPGKLVICGTNSYKPRCREYLEEPNGQYKKEREFEGIGICPYNPDHNSSTVFSDNQLYSATVADFSGGDPIIYRDPQRTEQLDLKQLNAPHFVSTVPYGEHIYFFFRETAVEYMNCGKIIYSRVARVCKNDQGGPHQMTDRWTSFLKSRLNCSVPGEYPFYFDEIQSTSEIINGSYGSGGTKNIIYGTLTTPNNAIGGSAICVYNMDDIISAFQGSFKHQEDLNSNWLPLSNSQVPKPRPGECVPNSRTLSERNVNFIKTHSLMEEAVPVYFGRPILIRVSLQYRFTVISVDPQVQTTDNEAFDILYIGTDDGRVLKVVNIPNEEAAKAVVISENNVLPHGTPIKQIKLTPDGGKIIVVGRDEIRLVDLNQCKNVDTCSACVDLQDPHCGWDAKQKACVPLNTVTLRRYIIQDVRQGDKSKCSWTPPTEKVQSRKPISGNEADILLPETDKDQDLYPSVRNSDEEEIPDCTNDIEGCAVKQKIAGETQTLHLIIVGACIGALIVGFISGFFFSRRFRSPSAYHDPPFFEQHNHLERLSGNQNFLPPRPNKTVNLVLNVRSPSPPLKKDNLDVSKDLNIANDGTLQKIKKTYI
ncbi:semaphorin-1A-like [Harmonia axyridis]|uniref:semaphorin-1A-like n=1 Tax=Harmonia axyridis TaxID=115357 RepID=UPI001E27634E|nr:semaphorin-1A-like [Harmonia axyridis]